MYRQSKDKSPIERILAERTPRARHRLRDEDRLFMLWAWSRGWSAGHAACGVPCSGRIARLYRQEVMDNPGSIFVLPVLLQIGPRKFQCQFCTETRVTRLKCMRHVLAHILPINYAKTAPIEHIEFL